MKITTAQGSGGKLTSDLIRKVFEKHFTNEILDRMEDAAVLTIPSEKIAFTTDSFVVSPLFFPGGDIGRLAICGTVNDLLMRGAVPKYLSAGFILEHGLDTEDLEKIVRSMKKAADEANVSIVAGDTKVIEGKGGLYINTTGIGVIETKLDISVQNTKPGDTVIISGTMGNHHACILSSRMGIENSIESDCAPLGEMVKSLLANDIEIHTMRDITRGGLATVLNEIAESSHIHIDLFDKTEISDKQVNGFCDVLGLDPFYMGNEGKLLLCVPSCDAKKALTLIQNSKYGENAQIIGEVFESERPKVTIKTRAGTTRILSPLLGEGLPRIC